MLIFIATVIRFRERVILWA